MGRKTISVLIALLVIIGLHATAFAHTASILITGGNRYKAVRLSSAVYNAANRDLSDLRIVDSAGQTVPYFIRSGSVSEESRAERYPMELINAYLKEEHFYFDYRVVGELDSDIIATSIAFSTCNESFAKEAVLYGSHDNLHWELVAYNTLYAVDGQEKLAVEFARPQKFTHYRLELNNNLEQIAFDSVELVYSETLNKAINFIETIRPAFSVEDGERQTLVHLEGLQNLRLCDITIETRNMFRRMVSASGGIRKELYHLSFEGAVYADTTMPLDRRISTEDIYTLTIADGDDRPIKISGVTVRYYADELIFEGAAGESYTLEFGANPDKTAPVFDIARYSDEILRGEIDRVTLGEIVYSSEEPKKQPRDYTIVFNVVIIVIAVLLGGVFFTRLRKN